MISHKRATKGTNEARKKHKKHISCCDSLEVLSEITSLTCFLILCFCGLRLCLFVANHVLC
jgi:hypothetical protein